MAKKSKKSIYRKNTKLGEIGYWATVWWGVSWLYLLLLFIVGKNSYIEKAANDPNGFFSDWWYAFSQVCDQYPIMKGLLLVVIAGWIIGGYIWLKELRRAKVSFKTALKDLFLTLR